MQADGSDADGSDDDAMGAAEPDTLAAAAAAETSEQDAERAAAAEEAEAGPASDSEVPWPAPGTYDMHKRWVPVLILSVLSSSRLHLSAAQCVSSASFPGSAAEARVPRQREAELES